MSEALVRLWMPAAWMDETVPQMEASPDAFISREGDGWRLRCPEGSSDRHELQPGETEDGDPYNDPLEPGQVVNFCYHENYGLHDVTVAADGSWTCATTWPEHASQFWIPWDIDTLADSMDDLVSGGGTDRRAEPLEPGTHVVGVYHWSDHFAFRFEVDAAGGGRFVACAGVS